MIWLDLELTDLEDPEVLECMVIITDKDLNEVRRVKEGEGGSSPLLSSPLPSFLLLPHTNFPEHMPPPVPDLLVRAYKIFSHGSNIPPRFFCILELVGRRKGRGLGD
jgi:hypothetical protein